MNLDHLDDPLGFTPDDRFRAAAQRDGRRRRTRRRLALATGSVLTSMAVLVAALAGYGLWRTSQIDRVDVEFAAPPVSLDEPFNILLIGSDSREGTSFDDRSVVGARTDTMIIVRVVPTERSVELFSLPRDLVLDPSLGAGGRLNTVFAEGGPAALVSTVEGQLGIPLSGYVEVDFEGFVDLVNAGGGVPMSVTSTLRDQATGLALSPSSCTVIDGETALALARSRHLETLSESGRWVEDPTSDFGRMQRQRTFLQLVASRLPTLAGSMGGARAALDVLTDHVTVDDRLDVATLFGLARWVVEGPPVTVTSGFVPTVPTMLGQASVLVLGPGAGSQIDRAGGSLPTQTADAAAGTTPGTGSTISEPVSVVPFGPCP
jgi:LCP family protein required for cell wall assembly